MNRYNFPPPLNLTTLSWIVFTPLWTWRNQSALIFNLFDVFIIQSYSKYTRYDWCFLLVVRKKMNKTGNMLTERRFSLKNKLEQRAFTHRPCIAVRFHVVGFQYKKFSFRLQFVNKIDDKSKGKKQPARTPIS
jgi:hypothetical protein